MIFNTCAKNDSVIEVKDQWSLDKIPNKTGKYKIDNTTYHYLNNKFHREDGPAVEGPNFEWWYQNGKRHRIDGPALEWSNGYKEWYQDGLLHRSDGPAIEWTNGEKFWYINDVEVSEEDVANYSKITKATAFKPGAIFEDTTYMSCILNMCQQVGTWEREFSNFNISMLKAAQVKKEREKPSPDIIIEFMYMYSSSSNPNGGIRASVHKDYIEWYKRTALSLILEMQAKRC